MSQWICLHGETTMVGKASGKCSFIVPGEGGLKLSFWLLSSGL